MIDSSKELKTLVDQVNFIDLLQKHPNFDINNEIKYVDHKIVPLTKKSGIYGEHYFLKVAVQSANKKENKEFRYFFKTLPSNPSQRKYVMDMQLFDKEQQFFETFINEFGKNNISLCNNTIPKCYATGKNKFLILEDLSEDFRVQNARCSFTLPMVKATVQSMVNLHASALIYEEKTGICLKTQYPTEFEEVLYNKKIPSSVAALESCIKGVLTQLEYFQRTREGLKEFAAQKLRDFFADVQESTMFRNTLCHGDLWASNIMLNENNDSVKLVDFQMYRYAPPALDLMSFLYLATDRSFRKQHKSDVLDYYYDSLADVLKRFNLQPGNVISRSEFRESVDYYEKFAIAQSVTHFQIVMMDSHSMAEFLENEEFNKHTMFEDRSELILKVCRDDSFYRAKSEESINDLEELFLRSN